MGKTNTRLELARTAYREALEAARTGPSREAWVFGFRPLQLVPAGLDGKIA